MSKETAQDIENNTAGNIYKMGMDIIMEKPASAIVAGGTDLDKLLTQLERKYGDATKTATVRHGMTKTRIYSIWQNMKCRCYIPSATNYKWYGGKGIKVCDRWKNSFVAFYEDMHETYTDEMTIERVDRKGDYTPENCTWIKMKYQAFNKDMPQAKLTREIAEDIREIYKRKEMSQMKLAEKYGVNQTAISQIIRQVSYGPREME